MELELVESYITNMQYAWIPLVGAAVVVLAMIAAISVVATVKHIGGARRIFSLIAVILWACIFAGGEVVLFLFANAGKVTGANALFILCSACVCAGGLIALGSNVWHLLERARANKKAAKAEELANTAGEAAHGADPEHAIKDKTEADTESEAEAPSEKAKTLSLETSDSSVTDALPDEGSDDDTSEDPEVPGPSSAPTQQAQQAPQKPSHPFRKARRFFNEVLGWALPLLAIGIVTLLCFVFLELPSNWWLLGIIDPYLTCEITIIAGVVTGVWLICQRRPIGFIIPMAVAFIYGLAEFFVELFKSAAIMPGDLRSANTGMAVAGGYEYEITTALLFTIALFALAIALVTWLKDPLATVLAHKDPRETDRQGDPLPFEQIEKRHTWSWVRYFIKNVAAVALSILLGCYLITTPISEALETDWEEEGIVFDYWRTHESVDEFGIIPSFVAALQLENIKPPAGYTHEEAIELQDGLAELYDEVIEPAPARQAAAAQFDQVKPNVVLVMNESFSDLSFMSGLGVNYAGPEFLRNMDAIAKGKTSVSVYGGNTCNSEFESLSGIGLGYIAGGINPYSVYDLSQINSIPKQFKALGYNTTAIHPEAATNWDRDSVYPAIGFDQFIDGTAFEGAELVREHVSDAATYEMVLQQLAASDTPQFIFDLTMMGHGGYETGLIPANEQVNYDFTGIVDEDAAAEANEYLASIKMSDEDLQEFIAALQDFVEPTVVVFFGDHQPGFSWYFKEQFADESSEVVYQESMYQTDYFIWSNYAIEGSSWTNANATATATATAGSYPALESNTVEYRGSMAPAMLMSWTMSYIGAPLTDFEKATYVGRSWIQSSNLYGYMDVQGVWHPESELEAVDDNTIFTQGEAIIAQCAETGTLPAPTDISAATDAVMANVMKWLNYLNFAEKIK
ncbi:LTA synthase family protein [Anaerotardibacter muris]|uniref:LTA synthase family protein n=1 Tax=Anaerotardibacter muris TaxID=2941505 RepID=UPI00203F5B14|nr:LTA synthase family protein [Anaerotardibacter muris]